MHTIILLIKVTVLLAAALLLVGILRRANPRWRMLVCEIAAAGLLVLPLLVLLPLSLPLPVTGFETIRPMAPVDRTEGAPQFADNPGPAASLGEEVRVAPSGESVAPVDASPSEWKHSIARGLLTVYLAVLGLLLIRYAWAAKRLKNALGALQPAGESLLLDFRAMAKDFGLREDPQLLVAEANIAPFACGSKGGTVVVPRKLLEPGQGGAFRMALRHELHHLANSDLRRTSLLQFAAMVLWFHPLMWALRRCHLLAMEELGDRVAAEENGMRDYSRALAKFALALRPDRQLTPVTAGWFRRPLIVRRLRMLNRRVPYPPIATRSKLLAIAIVAGPFLMLVSMLGVAHPKHREGTRAGLSPRLAAGLPEETVNRAAEAAVRALRFLESLQREDGSFSQAGEGEPRQQTGTTGMAGMAFHTYGGSQPGSSWRAPMLRALDYVLATQDEAGTFCANKEGQKSNLYHHFIATWFLASAKGSVDPDRKKAIEKALARAVPIILKAQRVKKAPQAAGGWRYAPNSQDSDISCTAWAMRALLAAKEAGMAVPREAIEDGISFILRLQNENDGGFAYTAGGGGSNLARTGMALYLLEKTGRGDTAAAARASAYILENASKESDSAGAYHYYGMYWCASAMAIRGGNDAGRYAEWMYPHCIEKQAAEGSFTGSLGSVLPTISVALAMSPDSPRIGAK